MSELKGLLLAIDLATRRRDEAGAVMVQIRRIQFGARNQMEQLESYATETESAWALGSRASANPEIMRHYDLFMDRLQQAVGLQHVVLTGHVESLAAARQVLLEAEVRIAGLNHLLKKKRAAIARGQAGREQKQLDEMAALQYRRRHTDTDFLESS